MRVANPVLNQENREKFLTKKAEAMGYKMPTEEEKVSHEKDPSLLQNEFAAQVRKVLATYSTLTPKTGMAALKAFVIKAKLVAEELDNVGRGDASSRMGELIKKGYGLRDAVRAKKIRSIAQFKKSFKPILIAARDFDVSADAEAIEFKESTDFLKSLEHVSLSEVFARRKARTIFTTSAPIIVTGMIPKTAISKMEAFWDITNVVYAGWVIEGAKFLVLDREEIEEDNLKEFAQTAVSQMKQYISSPLVPFFDIAYKTKRFTAVLLIPEAQARFAVQCFEQAKDIMLYFKP